MNIEYTFAIFDLEYPILIHYLLQSPHDMASLSMKEEKVQLLNS